MQHGKKPKKGLSSLWKNRHKPGFRKIVSKAGEFLDDHWIVLLASFLASIAGIIGIFIPFLQDNSNRVRLENATHQIIEGERFYSEHNDPHKAESLLKDALLVQQEILGEVNPDTIITKTKLAEVYFSLRDYLKARELYLSLFMQIENQGPSTASQAADYCSKLARTYLSTQDYDSAIEWNDRAIEFEIKTLQQVSVSDRLADLYEQRGYIYFWSGNSVEATACFQERLTVLEKMYGMNSPEIVPALLDFGDFSLVLGNDFDVQNARRYYERAYDIQRGVLGDNHLDVRSICLSIASTYSLTDVDNVRQALDLLVLVANRDERMNDISAEDAVDLYQKISRDYSMIDDYEEAIIWAERAVAICEEVFGVYSEATAQAYRLIANHYAGAKEYDKAVAWGRKMILSFEGVSDFDEHNLHNEYGIMAFWYGMLRNDNMKLRWLTRQVTALEKSLGTEHIRVADVYKDMGYQAERMERFDDALHWYQKELEIRRAYGARAEWDEAAAIEKIGNLYRKQGLFDDALIWLLEAMELFTSQDGEKSYFVASICCDIGAVALGKEDYSAAITWYKKGVDIHESMYGPDDFSTGHAYVGLGNVYSQLGQFSDAIIWYEKALHSYEFAFGPENSFTSSLYYRMGVTYYELNKYLDAKLNLQKAYTLYQNYGSADNDYEERIYYYLAETSKQLGDDVESGEWQQKRFHMQEVLRLAEEQDTGFPLPEPLTVE